MTNQVKFVEYSAFIFYMDDWMMDEGTGDGLRSGTETTTASKTPEVKELENSRRERGRKKKPNLMAF